MLLAVVLFLGEQLPAQDTLFMSDGNINIVRDVVITDSQIRFRMLTEPDGPFHVIAQSSCFKIVRQDGQAFVFKNSLPPGPNETVAKEANSPKSGRNFISVNVVDLFYRSLTINYEFLSRQGNLSIKCPLSIGFVTLGLSENKLSSEKYWQAYYQPNKDFSIGLELLYYPGRIRKVRYFAGPGFEYGQYDNYTDDNYSPYKSSFFTLLVQTGAMFQISKHMAIAGNLGLGSHSSSNDGRFPFNTMRFGISMGYKF